MQLPQPAVAIVSATADNVDSTGHPCDISQQSPIAPERPTPHEQSEQIVLKSLTHEWPTGGV